jgi:hypothetical protein
VLVGIGRRAGVRSVEIRWHKGRAQTINDPPVYKYLTISEQK